jgi:hypothetical protein
MVPYLGAQEHKTTSKNLTQANNVVFIPGCASGISLIHRGINNPRTMNILIPKHTYFTIPPHWSANPTMMYIHIKYALFLRVTFVRIAIYEKKEVKKLYYKEVIIKSKNKMKTTWNIIHKEKGNPTNENNIKSLIIKNHIVRNQISIANEFNDYFLSIKGNISNKQSNEKEENVSPLQSVFKYFNPLPSLTLGFKCPL